MNAMKTGRHLGMLGCMVLLFLAVFPVSAQTKYTAIDVPSGTAGNQSHPNWGYGGDFYVTSPIEVWELGAFDDLSDGIRSGTTLTVQLYAKSGNSGTLLETLTFDAANPGRLQGGNRFKTLSNPVTLLPGPYSIVAYGFDATNRAANASKEPYNNGQVPWTLNDGGGLIQFVEGRHGTAPLNELPHLEDKARPDFFAAASFIYSAGSLPIPPNAADYAALTAGVTSFPYTNVRRSGSLAVLSSGAFPVIVEKGGDRYVLEAAGTYNSDPNGGRAVAFAHSQWGTADDAREALFENAIRWASKKSNPADIMIGMGPMLNTNYFIERGYQVKLLPTQLSSPDETLPACDVMAVNWNVPFDAAVVSQIQQFTAQGGNLVVTMMPWFLLHEGVKPEFAQINALIQPFGLAYRPSTAIVGDLRFTNVVAQPYPVYFSAYPAALLLGEDHLGEIKLTSLEKIIALNTINYAINARPDLMEELTAISSGNTNNPSSQTLGASSFEDTIVLSGSQANTNRLGQWQLVGNDLVSLDRRGVVEYNFTTQSADVYRLEIYGTQNLSRSLQNDFDLLLSVDGVSLGHQHLIVTNGLISCFTPYLPSGSHTLRIVWDNAASYTSLRLQSIHVQTGLGQDSDGNGIKDWVETLVHSQSGMDITNATLNSYVSPICLEGRDPYPSLVQLHVQGSQSQTPALRRSPNNRWFANVGLSSDQNTALVLNVNYQNGALSEWKNIQWTPINLINATNLTIRKGDSLLLTAWPTGTSNAPVQLTVGTNQRNTTAMSPLPFKFDAVGSFTVTGTYRPNSAHPQTGSITVNVVGCQFPGSPDAWALHSRYWDLTNVPSQAVFESDSRMLFEQASPLTDGYRTELITDENEPRFILSRLGNNGPILDTANVGGFQFWSSEGTYTKILQTYTDGSQLIETLLIMSPVPADISVKMDVIVGGAMFTDGTTSKTLSATDFDTLGRCKVQFIRPAGVKTSVCHTISLFQNGVPIGTVQ